MHDQSKRRLLFRSLAAFLFLIATFCGRFLYGLHAENAAMQSVVLPAHLPPPAGARVLVIAPHCDDETLGAGGLIAGAVRRGAHVSVAFITNGDGFPMAVSRQCHRLRPRPSDYESMARRRQGEARRALARLGVPRQNVYFLGYPDRGIADLWNQFWSPRQPYTSRFTGCSISPYGNSFHPQAVYCGQDLLADLERLLRRERPQWLYVTHPADDHPDHWATYCFTTAALEELRDTRAAQGQGRWLEPHTYTYLVHHGDWPVPQGLRREARLVPPASLVHLDTIWTTQELTSGEEADKEGALLCYRSQTAVMKRFLISFIRRDELFGFLPPQPIYPADPGFTQWQPALTASTCETLFRRLDGSGDLVSLEAGADPSAVLLRLVVRRPLSPRLNYVLRLHPLGGTTTAEGLTVPVQHLRCVQPAATALCVGNELRVRVPLTALGRPAAMLVGAESWLGGVRLDRVGWRLLRLPGR